MKSPLNLNNFYLLLIDFILVPLYIIGARTQMQLHVCFFYFSKLKCFVACCCLGRGLCDPHWKAELVIPLH